MACWAAFSFAVETGPDFQSKAPPCCQLKAESHEPSSLPPELIHRCCHDDTVLWYLWHQVTSTLDRCVKCFFFPLLRLFKVSEHPWMYHVREQANVKTRMTFEYLFFWRKIVWITGWNDWLLSLIYFYVFLFAVEVIRQSYRMMSHVLLNFMGHRPEIGFYFYYYFFLFWTLISSHFSKMYFFRFKPFFPPLAFLNCWTF